jgi:hypothetical protein
MDINVKLRCFGMRLENGRFSDPTYCEAEKQVHMVRENL